SGHPCVGRRTAAQNGFQRPEDARMIAIPQEAEMARPRSYVRTLSRGDKNAKTTPKGGFSNRGFASPVFVTARRIGPHRQRGHATRSDQNLWLMPTPASVPRRSFT